MLTAVHQVDLSKVFASDVSKVDGPFSCPACGREVYLRKGRIKVHHFAHKPPVICAYGKGESEAHRTAKKTLYESLLSSGVNVELEKYQGGVISDVFLELNGQKVAIEFQASSLTVNQIISRTQTYARLGIYVLWSPIYNYGHLYEKRFAPKVYEKWLHCAYFGRVFYYLTDTIFSPIHFSKFLLCKEDYKEYSGYIYRSKRYREPVQGDKFNILHHASLIERDSFKSDKIYVPSFKLVSDLRPKFW